MTDRERLPDVLSKPIFPHELVDPLEAVADYLLDNGVTFAKDTNDGCKWISVEDRVPEVDVSVMVIVSGKPTSNITLKNAYELAEYDPEGWILEMWPEWVDAKVSYWMSLPEPPKEVDR